MENSSHAEVTTSNWRYFANSKLRLRSKLPRRGRAVLNNVSEQIRECYRRAEDCARKAATQTDPKLKADFLDLERRWLVLARSYDFTERLNRFYKK
jgi:hypothetical protein